LRRHFHDDFPRGWLRAFDEINAQDLASHLLEPIRRCKRNSKGPLRCNRVTRMGRKKRVIRSKHQPPGLQAMTAEDDMVAAAEGRHQFTASPSRGFVRSRFWRVRAIR